MLKKNIVIGLLIASSALNLTAYNDNIKVTKADVMWSDSQMGFATAGFTTCCAKIWLGKIDSMSHSVDNMPRLNPRWGMAVDTMMVGALLVAIARDAQRESSSDQRSDTMALVVGAVAGGTAAALPSLGIELGQTVGYCGGCLVGERGAEIGGTVGGFVGGATGWVISAGILRKALNRNASDLHKLIKPQDLE